MRILIIRHADPNYEIDGLTEKGSREAALLAKKLVNEKIDYIYTSPLGRARLTAKPTAEALGIEPVVKDWLREFSYETIDLPYKKGAIAWDLLPEYVMENPDLYSPHLWREVEPLKNSGVPAAYDEVTREFDELLATHGYVRDGHAYRVRRSSHDTIALFCHYGLGAVLVSHLIGASPYSIWQNMVLLPTGVCDIYTEERRPGIASMRMCAFGDTSHLYKEGEPRAFSARFSECFQDEERND